MYIYIYIYIYMYIYIYILYRPCARIYAEYINKQHTLYLINII